MVSILLALRPRPKAALPPRRAKVWLKLEGLNIELASWVKAVAGRRRRHGEFIESFDQQQACESSILCAHALLARRDARSVEIGLKQPCGDDPVRGGDARELVLMNVLGQRIE